MLLFANHRPGSREYVLEKQDRHYVLRGSVDHIAQFLNGQLHLLSRLVENDSMRESGALLLVIVVVPFSYFLFTWVLLKLAIPGFV
jgi:hypothetical protein